MEDYGFCVRWKDSRNPCFIPETFAATGRLSIERCKLRLKRHGVEESERVWENMSKHMEVVFLSREQRDYFFNFVEAVA